MGQTSSALTFLYDYIYCWHVHLSDLSSMIHAGVILESFVPAAFVSLPSWSAHACIFASAAGSLGLLLLHPM